jgi:hypothetical protein
MCRVLSRSLVVTILVTLIALTCRTVSAQEIVPEKVCGLTGVWGSVGGGSTVLGWTASYLGVTFATKTNRIYTVRVAGASLATSGVEPDRAIGDLSLLYGVRKQLTRYVMVTAAGGPGFTAVQSPGKFQYRESLGSDSRFVDHYEYQSKAAIGLALEGQVLLTAIPFATIGLNAFGNLNSQSSYLGGGLCVHLGWIR